MPRPRLALGPVALGLLALTGCLPVDAERPECFPAEGCADGRACVAGQCVAPPLTGRAVVRLASGCAGTCGAGAPCLVIEAAGRRVAGAIDGEVLTLPEEVPAGPATATVLYLAPEAACAPALSADTCTPALGCLAHRALGDTLVPAEGEWVIDPSACPAAVWADEAPADACGGGDDDCDGQADEDAPGVGEACSDGVGACRADGVTVCGPDGPVCDAPVGAPTAEVAGGGDEDCDGTVDEGLAECEAGTVLPCGDGPGACGGGTRTCDMDGVLGPCVDGQGAPLPAPGERPEACNGQDDDCDGQTDEGILLDGGPAVGEPCEAGIGACAVQGTVVCDAGAARCDATPLQAPEAEACDGQDDDCDGRVDEDFELGVACEGGVGACAFAGLSACGPDGQLACEGEAPAPGVEACNGLDDDCDGAADEDFPGLGGVCLAGAGGCEVAGVAVCSPDGAEAVCDAEPRDPSDEVCNGLDDDCDAAVDEGFDLQTDVLHCGACDRACVLPGAVPGCEAGACTLVACEPGRVDADGLAENGCECDPAALDLPDPGLNDVDCDGLDGDVDGSLFVDPLRGDDEAGTGAAGAPFATLAVALVAAAAAPQPVLLAAGEHVVAEALTVPAGVSLHGGYVFDDEGGVWRRAPPEAAPTVLRGPATVLRVQAPDAPIVIDALTIVGGDGVDGGPAAAVVAVQPGEFLTLRQVTIQAGAGGAGVAGAAGERAPDTAEIGGSGRAGNDPGCPGCGGDGGGNARCGEPTGGDGGFSGAAQGPTPGAPPSGGAVGEPADGGDGGRGEPGDAGQDGAVGGGASPFGQVDPVAGWVPTPGVTGGDGTPGGGGGGGAAGLAGEGPGGGGGGGGGGGCPGAPGAGGGSGGGSFALVVVDGTVTLQACTLQAGAGGDGADGGGGGLGGLGGVGGLGGDAPGCVDCTRGGDGGPGGRGGCGGPGGGGAGGPSVAVLRVGAAQVRFQDAAGQDLAEIPADALRVGAPGAGGRGGRGGLCLAAGDDGPAAAAAPVGCCTPDEAGRCDDLAVCPEEAP